MVHVYALAVGFILDMIFGDPANMPHPVRLIGGLISALDKKLNRASLADKSKFARGVLLMIVVAGLCTAVPALILFFCYRANVWLGFALEALMCYQLLAAKALKDESMAVYRRLAAGDLEGARAAVAMIVGRDTAALDDTGVAKAAVETVAENTSDGVIAPMFYMALGGAALGFFYKAVNTMDSMVGYRNEKYTRFGRAAARLDDVLNFVPARISAILMIAASFLLRLDYKNAWKIFRRDRKKHASPNSAHTEAAAAGALDIQLAGGAYYFGVLHKKQAIGDAIRPVAYGDIKRVNRLMILASVLALAVFCAAYLLIYRSIV